MSILQEYEQIRRYFGEPAYDRIERFLKENPEYLLGDVFYRKDVYEIFEKEEAKYLAPEHDRRVATIIKTSNTSPLYCTADKELAERLERGQRYIHKIYQDFRNDELQEAVDILQDRSKEAGRVNTLKSEYDKLANVTTGEIYGSIVSNHRMTVEDAVKLLGGIKNPNAGQDESDYLLNGKELWHAEIDIISAEDARALATIARRFEDMPEIWAPDDYHYKAVKISVDQAVKETYEAFQNAKHDGYITDKEEAKRWIDTWCCTYGDGYDPDARRETELRKVLQGLGDLMYLKSENGEIIWPIEALNSFNEKELEICKRILFPENKEARQAPDQQKNGGRGR